MDPNDHPDTPFSPQPLPDTMRAHVCKDGRCVILTQGGSVTPESRQAIARFLEKHGPKEK